MAPGKAIDLRVIVTDLHALPRRGIHPGLAILAAAHLDAPVGHRKLQ
jgi:hypothetical protein